MATSRRPPLPPRSTTTTTEDPVIAKMLQAMRGGTPPQAAPQGGNPKEIYLNTGSHADPNDPTPIESAGKPLPRGYRPPETLFDQMMRKYPRVNGGEINYVIRNSDPADVETQLRRIQGTRKPPKGKSKGIAGLFGAVERRLGLR